MIPICFQFFAVGVRKVLAWHVLPSVFLWESSAPDPTHNPVHSASPPIPSRSGPPDGALFPKQTPSSYSSQLPALPNIIHFLKSIPNHFFQEAAPDYFGRYQVLLSSSLQQSVLLCGTLLHPALLRCHSHCCRTLEVKGWALIDSHTSRVYSVNL